METILALFTCIKDQDVENFLRTKAIKYEKLGKSRTFLICSFIDGKIRIIAYFAIALQVIKISEQLSRSQIKNLDGVSYQTRGKPITEVPALLIGQLAKNDFYKNLITGEQLMEFCMNRILEGQKLLSGRVVVLECKNISYLINEFYSKFSFKIHETKDDGLIKLIRVLNERDLIS